MRDIHAFTAIRVRLKITLRENVLEAVRGDSAGVVTGTVESVLLDMPIPVFFMEKS